MRFRWMDRQVTAVSAGAVAEAAPALVDVELAGATMRARMRAAALWMGAHPLAVCAGGLIANLAIAVVGLRSPIVDQPGPFVALRTLAALGMLAVAFPAFRRPGTERLAPLLALPAYLFALSGLVYVDSPIPFAIGRIAITAQIVLFVALCLVYPRGRIERRTDAALLVVAATGAAAILAANLLLSPQPPVAGPFTRCSGDACPANPFNVVAVGSNAAKTLSDALALWTTGMLVVTALSLADRARRGTRLERRSLAPVFGWTSLTGLAYGSFIFARVLEPMLPVWPAIAAAGIIAASPIAFGLGLSRGRPLAVAELMSALGQRLTLVRAQRSVATAFADPTMQLVFWLPANQCYVDIHGQRVPPARMQVDKRVTYFLRNGEPVAAALHAPAVAGDAELLQAVGNAVVLALENGRLEAELHASIGVLDSSRRRDSTAVTKERRRIERDLHDGAQQSLIALRIRLRLLEELAADDPQAAADGLAGAGGDVDRALHEIRAFARGIYPAVLRDYGVSAALRSIAQTLPFRVATTFDRERRFDPDVETAVYFSCVEALQNVAKHCGPETRVRLQVRCDIDALRFVVSDDGPGFDPGLVTTSQGIVDMRERMAAVGGNLTIRSSPDQGTSVSGLVAATAIQ